MPKGCYATYWSAPVWKEFQNIIEIETIAESISLPETVDVPLNTTYQLLPTITPQNTTVTQFLWESSDPSIATVDKDGNVTALANGKVTITATTIDGSNISASCEVKIGVKDTESINFDLSEVTLYKGETKDIVCTVLPEDATDKSVTWKSDDLNIAAVRVNNDGSATILGVKAGQTIISATTNDGTNLSATCNVTILQKAESITLDKTEVTLKATETTTLVAAILPEDTSDKSVVWISSDENVATVDKNGVVTAVAVGEATITATTTDGSNLSTNCKVTVVPTLAESITLDKTEATLKATETTTLVATVLPELATDKSVTWMSSDENVATVDKNGVVTAITVGEATITATTTDGSNLSTNCKVTVVPTLAESITLDKTEATLKATETTTLVATVLPELATDKSVVWISSDESVATVDKNGVVTALAVGEATITATTTDGSNLSATCNVSVEPTLATSITLDKNEYETEEGTEFQLVATVLPDDTTNKEVEWNSSDTWIATVDDTGLVRVYKAGKVTITATTTDGSNLSASCVVNAVSGIETVSNGNLIVRIDQNNIIVSGVVLDETVRVFAADGKLVASTKATDDTVVMQVPAKGVYFVVVGKQSHKVII